MKVPFEAYFQGLLLLSSSAVKNGLFRVVNQTIAMTAWCHQLEMYQARKEGVSLTCPLLRNMKPCKSTTSSKVVLPPG